MKFVMHDKLYESTDSIQNQLDAFDGHRQQLMYDIAGLKNHLQDYVHNREYARYQEEMLNKCDKFATWEAVRAFHTELLGYIKKSDFNQYKDDIEHALKSKQEQIDLRMTIKDAEIMEDRIVK